MIPVFALSLTPAFADDNKNMGQYDPDSWKVTIKGNVGGSNEWLGSKDLSFMGYPSLSFRRPWTTPEWSSPDDALGFSFFNQSGFSVGAAFAYRGKRDSNDETHLKGIRDTRWTIESGLYAHYWAIPEVLRARMEVRRGFRSEDGFTADLGIDFVHKYDQFTFAIGPRATLADSRFMRNHFGITEEDSISNGTLSPWRPSGGIRGAGLFGSVEYQFNEQWSAGVHGGWERLVGDAAKSPIVEIDDSRDQFTVGATIKYTFDWKWSGFKF